MDIGVVLDLGQKDLGGGPLYTGVVGARPVDVGHRGKALEVERVRGGIGDTGPGFGKPGLVPVDVGEESPGVGGGGLNQEHAEMIGMRSDFARAGLAPHGGACSL